MSTVEGSNPTQSRVFVDEMRRRARRQVLGALALLFLSLTVLPVLFEKRPIDPSSHPKLRWEPTPAMDDNAADSPSTPANSPKTAKAETPVDDVVNPTSTAASNDDTGSAQAPTALLSAHTKPHKKTAETPAEIPTEEALTPVAQTAPKKARPEKSKHNKIKSAAAHHESARNLDVSQLRSDELDDIPHAALKKHVKSGETKTENGTSFGKATKIKLNDAGHVNSHSSYVVQLNASTDGHAQELRNRLNASGLNASVVKIVNRQNGTSAYRVRVGQRTGQREQAEKTLKALHSKGYNAVLVPLNGTPATPSHSAR